MFGLLNRATSSSSVHRRGPSTDSIPSPTSSRPPTATPISVQPSIDGPPSPGHIRAYTEQVKRGSVFQSRSRSYTTSSATPSFRSGSSGATSAMGEPITLSRQSSRRSNASSMPSRNSERPESIQGFGKNIFSRTSRKIKRNAGSRSSSSLSTLSTNPSMIEESQSAKDYYYNDKKGLRRGTFSSSASSLDESFKHSISGPYDFRHLTHTRHEQLPNLHRTSRLELAAEFSAIRASQAPTTGKLKGIKADDLHFKNFSSEALNASASSDLEIRPSTSHHRSRSVMKDEPSEETTQKLANVKSSESLRSTPPRPPRSPLTSTSPVPPPRTSSRTGSMIWGNFDPLATTSLERPDNGTGFRKPKAFHLPISPPRPLTRSDMSEDFIVPEARSPPRSPEPESWPLKSPFESFQLADVPEEEENLGASRRSRLSTTSGELRPSRSVPSFSPQMFVGSRNSFMMDQRPHTPPIRAFQDDSPIGLALSPMQPGIQLTHDSWEDDIDYCYEHEAEANFNYEWERTSTIIDGPVADSIIVNGKDFNPSSIVQPNIGSDLSSYRFGARRSQPHLIVPSSTDVPDLSPLSNNSAESTDVSTPGLLRPAHIRNASHASSFKESHGFTLSPSLLIPTDFSTQMDQDALYDELLFNDQDRHTALHTQHQFEPYPISPDDDPSSTASYRSSGYSRASTTTTISKTGSHESVVLLSRAASVALQHRSISSTASVPDLVFSSRPKRDTQDLELGPLVESDQAPELPSPGILRRKTSMGMASGSPIEQNESVLSTVAEINSDSSETPPLLYGPTHGRKLSAPLQSMRPAEAPKGRKRAMSAKSRAGNYNLFPQI